MAGHDGAVTLAARAGRAVAHHSFAMYEPTKTLTFKGTVKAFQWTNPHCVVWVLVQPDGRRRRAGVVA